MKRFFVFILVAVVLAAGAWYYYFWWQNSRVNLWTFIPDTAIGVFEPVGLMSTFREDEERKIFKNLKTLPELKTLQKELDLMDSLISSQDESRKILDNTNLLISFHRAYNSSSSINSLFLLEVNDLNTHDGLIRFQEYLLEHRGYDLSKRNYNGHIISELSDGQNQLAYILYKNFLLASFSPFLVEDAIRMLENGSTETFDISKDLKQAKSQKLIGEGRLYIDYQRLSESAGRVLVDQENNLSLMQRFSNFLYLDLAIQEETIDLTGFALTDSIASNYLEAYKGVKGASFSMKNVIPDHASLLVHMSFDNTMVFYDGLRTFWRKHNPAQLTRIGELENRYDFDRLAFYEIVDKEIGLSILNTKRSFHRDKILTIRHRDHIMTEQVFDRMAKASSADQLVSENYRGRRIGLIKIDEIPARLFGEMFSGFPEAYYFVDRDYIFIGNSLNALEVQIDDLDAENTWRKSLRTNSFLETTNEDANFSIYASGKGFWDIMRESLVLDWAKYIKDHELIFEQLEYGALQFTNVDDNFYTSLTVRHPGRLREVQQPVDFVTENSVELNQSIISKPFGVRNHNDRSLEMMVQDSSYVLHLISAEQKDILQIPLGGSLASPIMQVDYYKNGKLQYLFALDHSIHIIDRTGRYIPGYPVKVPSDQPVRFLSLLDYDGSKNYRIMAATEKSYYYMFDKSGRRLKGWNPKKLTGGPAMPARHLRVRKTDFMIFLQANGTVHGLNRKGLGKKGFPFDMKGDISSPLFITKGGTLASTELLAVTNDGSLLEFNLLGDLIRRDEFDKENAADSFELINAHDGKKFLVVKDDGLKLVIYNDNLEELFDIERSSSEVDFQFYNFNEGRELLIAVDNTNQLTYLYNMEGAMLHNEPLSSGHKLAVVYHERSNSYEIYSSSGSELKKLTLTP